MQLTFESHLQSWVELLIAQRYLDNVKDCEHNFNSLSARSLDNSFQRTNPSVP
jgi:hypothetical protein